MNYIPTTHKFIAVLNKKIEIGRALNSLGHMTAGLINQFDDRSEMRFQDYTDANNTVHPSISDNPFIVLRAKNGNQIRKLRNRLIDESIKFTDFSDTMIEGTYADQHKRTLETKEEELDYFGICFIISNELGKELTRKFSLYL